MPVSAHQLINLNVSEVWAALFHWHASQCHRQLRCPGKSSAKFLAAAEGTAPRSTSTMKNPPIRVVLRTLRSSDTPARTHSRRRYGEACRTGWQQLHTPQGASTVYAPEASVSLARCPELQVAEPKDVGGVPPAEGVGHHTQVVLCPIAHRWAEQSDFADIMPSVHRWTHTHTHTHTHTERERDRHFHTRPHPDAVGCGLEGVC